MSTLVSEGALGGREYAVRREDGVPAAYICMVCLAETPMERGAFLCHDCSAAVAAAPAPAARTPRAARGTSSAAGAEGEG